MSEDEISRQIVDAAIAVHRVLGPGLLESAYVAALEIELASRSMSFAREVPVQGVYRGKPLGVVYRADLIVMNCVLLEVKAIEAVEAIHRAQVLSYLRLGQWKLGLLLNFHSPLMKSGISRIVNEL